MIQAMPALAITDSIHAMAHQVRANLDSHFAGQPVTSSAPI